MTNPAPAPPPPNGGISRRSLLGLGGVAAGAALVGGGGLFAAPDANAAIVWGHPFTFRGPIGDRFQTADRPSHNGQDYPVAEGTPIYAVADGTVVVSMDDYYGWGVTIQIDHGDGFKSLYGHMQYGSRRFAWGATVRRGQQLGTVGNTGNSFGAHLHIEIWHNGEAIDPLPIVHNAPLAGTNPPAPEDPVPYHQSTPYAANVGLPANTWTTIPTGVGTYFAIAPYGTVETGEVVVSVRAIGITTGLQMRTVAEALAANGGPVTATYLQPTNEARATGSGPDTYGQHVMPYQLGGPMRMFFQVRALNAGATLKDIFVKKTYWTS